MGEFTLRGAHYPGHKKDSHQVTLTCCIILWEAPQRPVQMGPVQTQICSAGLPLRVTTYLENDADCWGEIDGLCDHMLRLPWRVGYIYAVAVLCIKRR